MFNKCFMLISTNPDLFKDSKEKINQFAELQKILYEINIDNINQTFHYLIDNQIINNDNDILHLIKIIFYGCEIRPLQIALYAHLCSLIHLSSKNTKYHQLSKFKEILKKYLFDNLISYNLTLLLYELMNDDFIDFQEINDTFIKMYDIKPNYKRMKNVLFFFAPELITNSKELYTDILDDSNYWHITKSDENQIQYMIESFSEQPTNSIENFNSYRFVRLNGYLTQMFKAIAVDNINYLLSNVAMIKDVNQPFMDSIYFQRFEFLNFSPSILMVAAYFDSINCFKILVKKADINQTDSRGYDCLSAAAAGGSLKIFNFLIFEKNVKIQEKTIHVAVKYHQHQILEIIYQVMKNNINYFNISIYSVKSHNLNSFLSSIHSSEIFNQVNEKNQTILMKATKLGIPELVGYIIQYYPFDIYKRDKKSRSLAYYAIKSSNLAVIQLILSLYKKDDQFLLKNEFFDASTIGLKERSNLVIENIICQACKNCSSEIIDYLLHLTDSKINIRSLRNYSLLHYACKGSNVDVVRYLLSKNDIDINAEDDLQQTPLFIAIMSNSYKIVKLLLEDNRIDVNHSNFQLMSPLHIAVEYSSAKIVKIVLFKNQDAIFNENYKSVIFYFIFETPLDIARINGDERIIELFLNDQIDYYDYDDFGLVADVSLS